MIRVVGFMRILLILFGMAFLFGSTIDMFEDYKKMKEPAFIGLAIGGALILFAFFCFFSYGRENNKIDGYTIYMNGDKVDSDKIEYDTKNKQVKV